MKITLIFFLKVSLETRKNLEKTRIGLSLTVLTLPLANIFILYIAAMKNFSKRSVSAFVSFSSNLIMAWITYIIYTKLSHMNLVVSPSNKRLRTLCPASFLLHCNKTYHMFNSLIYLLIFYHWLYYLQEVMLKHLESNI